MEVCVNECFFVTQIDTDPLQLVSSSKDTDKDNERKKILSEKFSLDTAYSQTLISFMSLSPLTTVDMARAWCIIFRLLKLGDPKPLSQTPGTNYSPQECPISARGNFNFYFKSIFTSLLNFILKSNGHENLLGDFMNVLVDTFDHAKDMDEPLLYLTLLVTLRSSVTDFKALKTQVLSNLLQHIATSFADPKADLIKTKSKQDKSFLQEVFELLNYVFPLLEPSKVTEFVKEDNSKSFLHLIKWIGANLPEPAASTTPQPDKSLVSLREEVSRFIDIVGKTTEGAGFLAGLCVLVLKEKPSPNIAQLYFKLARDEDLAYLCAIQLGGANFLFQQLEKSSSNPSSFTSPVNSAILSTIVAKSTLPPTDPKAKKTTERLSPQVIVICR